MLQTTWSRPFSLTWAWLGVRLCQIQMWATFCAFLTVLKGWLPFGLCPWGWGAVRIWSLCAVDWNAQDLFVLLLFLDGLLAAQMRPVEETFYTMIQCHKRNIMKHRCLGMFGYVCVWVKTQTCAANLLFQGCAGSSSLASRDVRWRRAG